MYLYTVVQEEQTVIFLNNFKNIDR